MKKLNVIFTAFLFLAANYLLLTTNSFAQYGQYGQSGGPPGFSIFINKMVGKPIITKGGITNVDYVDNLSPSDPRFAPGQDVWFRLKVKNTSSLNLKNVVVKDRLPNYLDPVEGPGTFDANTRIITITVGNISVDQTVEYFLKTRVQSLNQLPADKGLFCLVNKATTTGEADSVKPSAEDSSQLCIEKQVTQITPGVSQVPQAGPELGLVLLAGQFVALGAGMFLRNKMK